MLLDEQSILGMALGSALNGRLPIPEIQYLAYLHNAEDQLRGEAATLGFFSHGQYRNPMVVRIAGYGYQKGFGGHFHNDNSIAVLRDIPGLVIASPAHPADAAPMLRACVAHARATGAVCVYLEPIARYHDPDLHEVGDGAWSSAEVTTHRRTRSGPRLSPTRRCAVRSDDPHLGERDLPEPAGAATVGGRARDSVPRGRPALDRAAARRRHGRGGRGDGAGADRRRDATFGWRRRGHRRRPRRTRRSAPGSAGSPPSIRSCRSAQQRTSSSSARTTSSQPRRSSSLRPGPTTPAARKLDRTLRKTAGAPGRPGAPAEGMRTS